MKTVVVACLHNKITPLIIKVGNGKEISFHGLCAKSRLQLQVGCVLTLK